MLQVPRLGNEDAAWAKQHQPRRLPRARRRAAARQLARAGLARGPESTRGPLWQNKRNCRQTRTRQRCTRQQMRRRPEQNARGGPNRADGETAPRPHPFPHAFPFDNWPCRVRARPDWPRLAGPAGQSGLLRATPACVVLCGAGCPAGPGRWRPPPSRPQRQPREVGRPGPPSIRDCHHPAGCRPAGSTVAAVGAPSHQQTGREAAGDRDRARGGQEVWEWKGRAGRRLGGGHWE